MAPPTKSGLYLHTVQALFAGTVITGGPLNLNTAASWKIAAVGATASDGASPLNFSTATPSWVNTFEVVSTTNWPTGGILLSVAAATGVTTAPSFVEGTAGSLRYDMLDLSVATTTFATGPYGCIIYYDAGTSPADLTDAMLLYVNFGGAYPTNNGTFGITWSATGLFEIDLTP